MAVIPLHLIWVRGTNVLRRPYPQPHTLPQGVQTILEYDVKDELGAVVDITGWTFTYTLKEDRDDVPDTISRGSSIVDAPNGKARAILEAIDTVTQVTPELLPRSGPYVADVRAIRPGPIPELLMPASDVQLGPPVGVPGSPVTPAPTTAGGIIAGALQVKTVALVNVAALTGAQTVNGIALITELVLLTAQTDPTENGIWQVEAGAWLRPAAFPSGYAAAGVMVNAQQGTLKPDSQWVCASDSPDDVIDDDALTWKEAGGGLPDQAGNAGKVLKTNGTVAAWGFVTQDEILPAFSASFSSGAVANKELGDTISNPAFSISVNQPLASATLDDGSGPIALGISGAGPFAVTYGTGPLPDRSGLNAYARTVFGQSYTWTLTLTSSSGVTITRTLSASWYARQWFGASVVGTYDETFIEALAGTAAPVASVARTIALVGGALRFGYYWIPTAIGSISSSTISGFGAPFTDVATVNVVNAFGVSVPGHLFKTDAQITVNVNWVVG